jgi:hypothetical protein
MTSRARWAEHHYPDPNEVGATGPTGPTGATGPSGATGPTGASGSITGDPNALAFFNTLGTAITDNAKVIVDNSDPVNLRAFFNQTGPVPYPPATPSGAGLQYSSNVSGRVTLRLSQYGNNAGAQAVSFFKSRGTNIGDELSLAVGDTILNLTGIGVCGDNVSIPIAAVFDAIIPAGGVFTQSISPDFRWQLALSTINSRREIWRMVGLTGDFQMKNAGQRILVKEGTNAMQGVSTTGLGGTVVVSNTLITANTRISLTWQDGGVVAAGTPAVASRIPGTSFTIQSTNPADNGANVFWQLWEPAP